MDLMFLAGFSSDGEGVTDSSTTVGLGEEGGGPHGPTLKDGVVDPNHVPLMVGRWRIS